jgi:hypothetical protein
MDILNRKDTTSILCLLIGLISLLISLSLTVLVDELEQTQLLTNIIAGW